MLSEHGVEVSRKNKESYVHKGIKDHKCIICFADYITSTALSIHKIAKHSVG